MRAILLILLLSGCSHQGEAREHLADRGYEDIALEADGDGGFNFTGLKEGASCSGTLTVEGYSLGCASRLEYQLQDSCTRISVEEVPR